MFRPYKIIENGGRKEVVLRFLFMRVFMGLMYPLIMLQAIFLTVAPPFSELRIAGIWWIFFGTLLFLLIVPVNYSLKRVDDHIVIHKTDSFFRKTHLEIPISDNPRISGRSNTFSPSPGGFSVMLTSRNRKMFLRYEKDGKKEEVRFFPTASYFVSGNSTRMKSDEIKEIANVLDIPYEL